MFLQRPEPDSGRVFDNRIQGVSSLSAVNIASECDDNLTSDKDSSSFDGFSLLDEHGADGDQSLSKMCLRSNNVGHEPSKSAFADAEVFSVPSMEVEDISDGDESLASRLRSSLKPAAVKNLGYSLRPRKHNI